MKKISIAVAILISSTSFAQEIRQANIISVTPITDNIKVVKQQCGGSAGYIQQEPGVIGRVVGIIGGAVVGSRFGEGNGRVISTAVGTGVGYMAGSAYDNNDNIQPNCRSITTYEPTFGGFLVVYELDGEQYSMRSKTFPPGQTIPVKLTPVAVEK